MSNSRDPIEPASPAMDQSAADLARLQKMLAATASRARALLDQSPLAIIILDRNGTVVEANQHWLDLWRVDEKQVLHRYNVLDDPQFRDIGIDTFFNKALAGDNVLLPDFCFVPASAGFTGTSRWVRSHLFKIGGGDEESTQVVLAQMDISTCMLCEERYNIVVDNANEAIMVIQDGILKFFNKKALDIAGYTSKEDYLNKSFLQFVPPEHQQMIMDRHLRRQRGETVPNFYQVKVLHKKGHIIWLQLTAVKIEWEGRPASLAFLYDITEHKKAEEELLLYKNRLEEMVRERTRELEQALQEVRTLKGLIPVCVHCKNIRDDQGYWKLMEDYIRTHCDADITHGLCPECAHQLYPELFKSEKDFKEYQDLGRPAQGEREKRNGNDG